MKNILIVGATSAIAIAFAKQWASENKAARFFLIARNKARLKQVADDLTVRGATCVAYEGFDINDIPRHAEALEQCVHELGTLDIVFVAPGTLPDQTACQADPATAIHEFNTNATSLIAFLTLIANRLEAQIGAPTIEPFIRNNIDATHHVLDRTFDVEMTESLCHKGLQYIFCQFCTHVII